MESIGSIGHNRFHRKTLFSICERLRKIPTHAVRRGWKSFRWSPLDPLDTNRFHWKSLFSIRERLRKIPTHAVRGGWKSFRWSPLDLLDTIDSTGKLYFLFVRDFEKFLLMLYDGVESRSDGVHWIHWTRIDSTGKVYFLFVRDWNTTTFSVSELVRKPSKIRITLFKWVESRCNGGKLESSKLCRSVSYLCGYMVIEMMLMRLLMRE